jgi:hypothetical protein
MENRMIYEQNPLNGTWLCYIPETPVGFYIKGLKSAKTFTDKINTALESGKIHLCPKTGKLKKRSSSDI